MDRGEVRTRRWSRLEYERLIDVGIFKPGERLELLDGVLVVREPQGSPHATAIQLVENALRDAFDVGWSVRVQLPIALDDASEPEPDVAVVPGAPRDYRRAHPTRPALVVEVADTTLYVDARLKVGLYARAGIADYWVVGLADRALLVHRQPAPSPGEPYEWTYALTRSLAPDAVVSPLAAPAARIAVADLLP